jgi:hypothetical protein
MVGADQLALDAKSGQLQGDKIDIFESCAINRVAKHDCLTPCLFIAAGSSEVVH